MRQVNKDEEETEDEDPALLGQEVADYNTFTNCTKINIVCSQ